MSREDFKSLLFRRHREITGKDTLPSSNYKDSAFRSGPELDAKRMRFWVKKPEPNTGTHKARTVAYLTTYIEWNGTRFRADGIPLGDAFVLADKDVMHALLHEGCVFLDEGEGEFLLLEKGRGLIAPHLMLSEAEMGRQNAAR